MLVEPAFTCLGDIPDGADRPEAPSSPGDQQRRAVGVGLGGESSALGRESQLSPCLIGSFSGSHVSCMSWQKVEA
jgi:hypothetical protein